MAAGAQYLITRGLADPARLAIGGGSHGGTMTAYMVVHYPDLFAAAIELYGVVDRKLFVERTNLVGRFKEDHRHAYSFGRD